MVNVSLAYNKLSGSLDEAKLTNTTTPHLEMLDVRFNRINGQLPESLGELKNLKVLRTNLNYMTGKLSNTMDEWPIFQDQTTTTSILWGNLWDCPVGDAIKDRCDDNQHAYKCGNSEWVTPVLVAAGERALLSVVCAPTPPHPR